MQLLFFISLNVRTNKQPEEEEAMPAGLQTNLETVSEDTEGIIHLSAKPTFTKPP